MPSMPFGFYWEINRVSLDEVDLENFHTLEHEFVGDYFNVKVNVTHELSFAQPQSQIPFSQFSFQNSIFLPSQQFLENGPLYLQMYFPHPIIPNELIQSITCDVVNYAKDVVQNRSPHFHHGSDNFCIFALVLNVFVYKLYDERDDDIYNMILMESTRQVETITVPASTKSIESLEKVKLEDGAVMEECSICLDEFEENMEVSLMPCKHVYHGECIANWLKINHTCPICREPMPVD